MASETDTKQKDGQSSPLNREQIMAELKEKGYCVIPTVLTSDECDAHIASYRAWLNQFGHKTFPFQRQSIIQSYRIGHFQATWETRIAAKKVFESVWQTSKLLTSVDGVAISPPPPEEEMEEEGQGSEETHTQSCSDISARAGTSGGQSHWLHLDQSASRRGLHCYQGAVYLEQTCPSDYCFRVLEGSHLICDDFYALNPGAAQHSRRTEFCRLKDDQVQWFQQRGCRLTKVPVPKGGMVLWDSRTVHDNCKPEPDRPHRGRWRFVVFVSMGPARWASPADLAQKKQAYRQLLMTTHWPCQRVRFFSQRHDEAQINGVPLMTSLPKVARSTEVRLLAGVEEYDFEDGEPNGPEWDPLWVE